MESSKKTIQNGDVSIGIEFGSTRIKAVLIDNSGNILASGGFNWENNFIDGIWTYSLENIWSGLQNAYLDLTKDVQNKYQLNIKKAKVIGISGMMHGYMPFDKAGNLLVPFRTWRNNITSQSCKILSSVFDFNIPQRWSIAHLYQAILNKEPHVNQIDYFCTLAGYVHWQLTGEKVLGVGEASGMFPIDINTQKYNENMLQAFEQLIEPEKFDWHLPQILPKVLTAGQYAGKITEKGTALLDPTGNLQAGIPLCPPEGDAGTGMIATNSIKPCTGNISAGTSAFAMIVLDKYLSRVYEELDMVTTPDGKLVAMAHANNCSTDINAWVSLLTESLQEFGVKPDSSEIYQKLFHKALHADSDCGGLLSYGFHSGEHSVGLEKGCPLFIHPTNANFNLANFMRCHLYSAFAVMKSGVDILLQQEKVEIEQILAHGGIFKTENVAQSILASALNVPIATMNTAGEGGAWGIALLANYLEQYAKGVSLEQYLDQMIFSDAQKHIVPPDEKVHLGYQKFMQGYQQGIELVKIATQLQQ